MSVDTNDPTPQAVIVHGYGATPADHWFGWLAERLMLVGTVAAVPAMPHPQEPEADRWAAVLDPLVAYPALHTIVAHSLGTVAVLRALSTRPRRLPTLVLVAGFLQPLPGLPELDRFVRRAQDDTDLDGVRDSTDRIVVIRSDDDPIVPAGHTDALAAALGVEPVVVAGAGHFLAADGVTRLPAVLDACVAGHRR